MRGRVVAAIAGALVVGAGMVVGGAPPATAATAEVTIADNTFGPDVVRIAPGDTVRWTATRAGHTVTAEDGRFNFHPGRTLDAGEQVTWTAAATEEFVPYYCRIHAGMKGLIQVGDPPVDPLPPGPTVIVPDQSPTIAAAAAGAEPGTEILIRPGVYRDEAVTVATAGLTLRGLGVRPDDVVLRGGGGVPAGITITAPNIRVANLTITGFGRAGIVVDGASGAVIANATLDGNGLYGIDARRPTGLTLRALRVHGHGVAGISGRDCAACGLQVDGVFAAGNAAGVVVADASGVVVRGSRLQGNAVGVVLRDAAGVHVTGNTVLDNAATNVWVASVFDGSEPPVGAGVWIRGGRANRVAANTIGGHTYNVAVTGPTPAVGHRVEDNAVGAAVFADLGWDGIGAGVCFGGNKGSSGEPSSDPPLAQTLYRCSALATAAGLPYPLVLTNLATHARAAGYPL